ncbi:dom [Symbiodinium pilosum]|uniref:Dom protein n=1 Tax=Symbiodinium pilosum TaxID=2952 RepID=A0A812QKB7_SYMPI|nr:dom [Symbiodinium pilosum]
MSDSSSRLPVLDADHIRNNVVKDNIVQLYGYPQGNSDRQAEPRAEPRALRCAGLRPGKPVRGIGRGLCSPSLEADRTKLFSGYAGTRSSQSQGPPFAVDKARATH